MKLLDPDRWTIIGTIHVDLWRGLFRDEVRVWVDVRPALGGLLGRRTCWSGGGDALFEELVALVTGLVNVNGTEP